MVLHNIHQKPFKEHFWQAAIIMMLCIVISWFLVNNGYILIPDFDPNRRYTWPILLAVMVLSFIYSFYRKKQLAKIYELHAFEDQVAAYKRLFPLTMRWHIFSCIISCLMAVATARNIFLYFAAFDLLIVLPYYPAPGLFKRELRKTDILLHD